MKKFFGRAAGADKDKTRLTKAPPTRDQSSEQIEDSAVAPIYQQFHTLPPTQPAQPTPSVPAHTTSGQTVSPVQPRPVQRLASSGVDSNQERGEERWEVVDQRTTADDLHEPRAPALTGSHSSLGTHGIPLQHSGPQSLSQQPSYQYPSRPESPYSTASSHTPSHAPSQQPPRKTKPQASTAVAALGILSALNPQASVSPQSSPSGHPPPLSWGDDGGSEAYHSQQYHDETGDGRRSERRDDRKEKKGGFWSRDALPPKESHRERDKGKARDVNDPTDLVRMIGYLVATHADDWSFVLEVCERTNLNETNGREAAKALRKEFKYSEPQAQLSAAKLWAIMLNNCNEFFAAQCGIRKFLEVIEDVILSNATSPVVRDRLLEVLAGATYQSVQRRQDGKKHEKDGFQALWRKVKTPNKPDTGMPFDTEDAMFNPPTPRRMSAYAVGAPGHGQGYTPDQVYEHGYVPGTEAGQVYSYAQGPPLEPLRSPVKAETVVNGHSYGHVSRPSTGDTAFARPTHALVHAQSGISSVSHDQRTPPPIGQPPRSKNSSRNRVIPLEEDIRRLFQECKVGRGNATVLSQSLAFAKPQDLKKDIIEEFYIKCQASQDFIITQIPWATAGADRSREERIIQLSVMSEAEQNQLMNEQTVEEQLLSELLDAHEVLLESLRMYEDLQRIGMERQAEILSRQETRMPRSQIPYLDTNGSGTSYDSSVGGSYKSSANGSHLGLPMTNGGTGGSSRSSSPPSPTSSPASVPSTTPLPPPSIPHHPSYQHHQHSGSLQSIQSAHGPLPRPPGSTQGSGAAQPQLVPASSPPMQHHVPTALLAGSLAPPTRFGPRSPAHLQVQQRSRTPSPERGGLARNDGRFGDATITGKAPLPAPPGSFGHPGSGGAGSIPTAYASPPMRHVSRQNSADSAVGALRRLDISSQRSQRPSLDYGSGRENDDESSTPVKPSIKALGKRKAVAKSPTTDRFDPDDLFHDRSDSDNDWPRSELEDEDAYRAHPSKPVRYAYDAVAERHEQLLHEGKLAQLADLAAPHADAIVR